MPLDSSLLYGEMVGSGIMHMFIPIAVSLILQFIPLSTFGQRIGIYLLLCGLLSFCIQAAFMASLQAQACSGIKHPWSIVRAAFLGSIITLGMIVIPVQFEPMRLIVSQLFGKHRPRFKVPAPSSKASPAPSAPPGNPEGEFTPASRMGLPYNRADMKGVEDIKNEFYRNMLRGKEAYPGAQDLIRQLLDEEAGVVATPRAGGAATIKNELYRNIVSGKEAYPGAQDLIRQVLDEEAGGVAPTKSSAPAPSAPPERNTSEPAPPEEEDNPTSVNQRGGNGEQADEGLKPLEYEAQTFKEIMIGSAYWAVFAGMYGIGAGAMHATKCKK